jgi:hypothetical protein
MSKAYIVGGANQRTMTEATVRNVAIMSLL